MALPPQLKKLSQSYIWKRIFYERLTEPLHLNLISAAVALGGSFRAKVDFDLVLRAQHAYSILKCGDLARRLGIPEVVLIEFGVAAGAGMMNMCSIADRVTKETGVRFRIFGFDTGQGMPPPTSYKDHPDLYQAGDFPMDRDKLRRSLPANAELVLGEIEKTAPDLLSRIDKGSPIGFVSIDVDYYSSTKDALRILNGESEQYLPRTLIYLDDLEDESHNRFCGEHAAILEFNDEQAMRKIDRFEFLRGYRIMRNARWIDHMFTLHVLNHPTRSVLSQSRPQGRPDESVSVIRRRLIVMAARGSGGAVTHLREVIPRLLRRGPHGMPRSTPRPRCLSRRSALRPNSGCGRSTAATTGVDFSGIWVA